MLRVCSVPLQSPILILQSVPETHIIQFGRVSHPEFNCLLVHLLRAEVQSRCFSVTLLIDKVHVDVQDDYHEQLDGISYQHSKSVSALVQKESRFIRGDETYAT
jgi:3-deoxy-D-arabino-heptulosonate 7-phosphate (DAHP) synthase